MAYFFQPSLSGLLLQALGVMVLAALSFGLLRTVHRRPVYFWSIGWFTLFLSLAGLWLAFYFQRSDIVGPTAKGIFRQTGQVIYLFGEYVFGYLVVAGCQSYATGASPSRKHLWLLVPLLVLAIALAQFAGGNVNVFFAIHTLIYPYLFFSALRVLRNVKPGPDSAIGLRVMKIALLLLTVDYLHYAPFFAASVYQKFSFIDIYLTYAPLYDLIFQVMLMFGMVMLVTGQVQQELEAANTDLKRARDRLEATSRVDPLTLALNRRAFAAAVQERRRGGLDGRGVVAVVDLDELKVLNDRYGHAAGDTALRTLADGLRSCMNAGDLLFRWGGDEFVLLIEAENQTSAELRFQGLNDRLNQTELQGAMAPVDLRASIGLAEFADLSALDTAIARADQAMYRRKKPA